MRRGERVVMDEPTGEHEEEQELDDLQLPEDQADAVVGGASGEHFKEAIIIVRGK